MTAKRKAAYEAEVTIKVKVLVTGRERDFDTVMRDDLHRAITGVVEDRMLASGLAGALSEIYIFRGPGGSRYFHPDEPAPDEAGRLVVQFDKVVK